MKFKYSIYLFGLMVFTNLNAQSVIKSNLSSFTPIMDNDSLIISVGQSINGQSANSTTLLHGYLPLTKHFLGSTELVKTNTYTFPNPTQDFLFIKTSVENNIMVEIYASTGNLIYNRSTDLTNPIDVTFLTNGLYFIVLKNNNSIINSSKFIKY